MASARTRTTTDELRAPDATELRHFLGRSSKADRPVLSVILASPLERGFTDLQQRIPLELREARETAAGDLRRADVAERERERILAPLHELQERLEDASQGSVLPPLPWTLAHYSDAEGATAWALAHRLPAFTRPLVAVSGTPRVLPLLGGLRLERRFRALAVSVNRVALYEGDARGLRELPATDVPSSLADALGERIEPREDHQHHTTARVGRPGAMRGRAVHHGHGGAPDERSTDLERFHHAVANAATDHWRGQEAVPLVLVADATHRGRFSKTHRIPGLIDGGVHVNPDRLSEQEVYAAVWPAIREHVEAEASERARELETAPGQGERYVDRLAPLARRAVEGRVERVWIARGAARPGQIVEQTGELSPGRPGDDAVDQLACLVLRHGGDVHVVDEEHSPSQDGLAALLRG